MLERTTFRTSRLLEFCSRKELVAQTGHEPDAWPLVVLKELVDNALDACEEAGIAPEIAVQVEPGAITVLAALTATEAANPRYRTGCATDRSHDARQAIDRNPLTHLRSLNAASFGASL